MRFTLNRCARAFTLLEVMIAVAFLGIALLALLALHHSDMVSVIRAQDLTRASMLAQALMSEAEMEQFPAPGTTSGNFEQMYPGQYPNLRWQRTVAPVPRFPDLRRVRIVVAYGPGGHRSFALTEFMHDPFPQVDRPNGSSPAPEAGAIPLGGPGAGQP